MTDTVCQAQVSEAARCPDVEEAVVTDAVVFPAWAQHVSVFEGHKSGDVFFGESKADGFVQRDNWSKLLKVLDQAWGVRDVQEVILHVAFHQVAEPVAEDDEPCQVPLVLVQVVWYEATDCIAFEVHVRQGRVTAGYLLCATRLPRKVEIKDV